MDTRRAAVYPRPDTVLAGFHADRPEPAVPELAHLGEQWASRAFFVGPHQHSVWEWYVQESGASRWNGPDGQTYALNAGGFLAVPPGAAHTMREKSAARHHFFFAALDMDLLCARLPLLQGTWNTRRVVFSPQGETLLAPFRHLTREVTLVQPLRAAGVRAALDALVIAGTRLALGAIPLPLVARHPATALACRLMEQSPGEKWTLARLAEAAGLSAGHFAETFARDMGIAPHQFLLGERLGRAAEMLRGSDLPVTDIALELGFASSQHFAAAFKKATGQTARAHRAALSRNQAENKLAPQIEETP